MSHPTISLHSVMRWEIERHELEICCYRSWLHATNILSCSCLVSRYMLVYAASKLVFEMLQQGSVKIRLFSELNRKYDMRGRSVASRAPNSNSSNYCVLSGSNLSHSQCYHTPRAPAQAGNWVLLMGLISFSPSEPYLRNSTNTALQRDFHLSQIQTQSRSILM